MRDGEEKAHTEVTKTRVDVVFPVTETTIELDTSVEKHKNEDIVIALREIGAGKVSIEEVVEEVVEEVEEAEAEAPQEE